MHNGHEEMGEFSQSAQEKMKKLIEDVTARSKALFAQGLESAKDLFGTQAENIRKAASEMKADEIPEKVRLYVRKNPLKSLGIAAGVGVFIGLLFRPREK